MSLSSARRFSFFFFNDTATTEIYTLSLHDALPIWRPADKALAMLEIDRDGFDQWDKRIIETLIHKFNGGPVGLNSLAVAIGDRKSTRLNSSHSQISYAVFCLKKKKHYSI